MMDQPSRDAAILAARTAILAARTIDVSANVIEITSGDLHIIIRIKPAAPAGDDTPCERDLLDLLARAPMPLTTQRVLAQLETAGKLHGESTVRHALARLVGAGKITNSRRPPRGYRLADSPPSRAVRA